MKVHALQLSVVCCLTPLMSITLSLLRSTEFCRDIKTIIHSSLQMQYMFNKRTLDQNQNLIGSRNELIVNLFNVIIYS